MPKFLPELQKNIISEGLKKAIVSGKMVRSRSNNGKVSITIPKIDVTNIVFDCERTTVNEDYLKALFGSKPKKYRSIDDPSEISDEA